MGPRPSSSLEENIPSLFFAQNQAVSELTGVSKNQKAKRGEASG